jgi:phosphoribosylformylglycinamidine (FGAM) synthase-like enzyme
MYRVFISPVDGTPFPFRSCIEMRRTVVASCPVVGIMVVSVNVSMSMQMMIIAMVINRSAVIIITSAVIAEMYMKRSRKPTCVYPTITATIIFPIAGNPISIGIRS